MAQSYVWKVTCVWRINIFKTRTETKVFTNKVEAMQYESKMQNNSRVKSVKLEKYFGC